MAEVIIHLEVDPQTKKKNIYIKYESDADALPIEHEEEHRRIVDKLINGGALRAEDVGNIIIEREGVTVLDEQADQTEDEQQDRKALEQKG